MIIIPMAGLSSRFFKAGYTKPKYMLMAHGQTLFEHSVNSFKKYFDNEVFLFVVKDDFDTKEFVEEKSKDLKIKKYHIVTLCNDTRGQAETVMLGLNEVIDKVVAEEEPITIFNIDTFRPNFEFPEIKQNCDGYLEVFKGTGSNWSFAKPFSSDSTKVVKTAEKSPISDFCSTGLYHFARLRDFKQAYDSYVSKTTGEWEKGELYIAPLYNHLIENGADIHYHLIKRENVIFCGVPEEYQDYLRIE